MLQYRRTIMTAVLLLALIAAANKPAAELVTAANSGAKLSDDEARGMETMLVKHPDDAELRARLLGFYQVRKAAQRDARAKDILWMIEHCPANPITATAYCMIDPADDPDDYARGKEAWDQQLGSHSTDATITANGAAFRAVGDFSDAQGLLTKAESLEPKNAVWPERLAIFEERRMGTHPDETSRLANDALQQRQSAYNLTPDPEHRFHILIAMPEDAMHAENFIQAKHLANQLIGTAEKFHDDREYGDAIHRGNIALGEEALVAGNVEHAEEFLAAAGETPGSPTLATVGPDLSLAKKLLARGERTAVRAYLTQCLKFWKEGEPRLRTWISSLDSGGTPDLR